MILSDKRIAELIEDPANRKALVRGSSLQNKHKLHITGKNFEKEVLKVDGFESTDDYNVKLQVAKPATIQITSIILDNLNRWTSAQGTVKKAEFKDKNKNDRFKEVLDQVWRYNSFENFINTFYKDAIYTEFNGFVLVTKPKIVDGFIEREGVLSPKPEGNLDPYMIFIANEDIQDFMMSGDTVEYLIISLDDKGEKFRVIDDARDIIIDWDPSKKQIVGIEEIPNEIGYVPARRISSIKDDILSSQVSTSPIAHIMPALDRYFSCDADLRMQFIRHNYPKLAIVTKECTECSGTGHIYDEKHTDTQVTCKTCRGSGKIIPITRDGVIGLPQYLAQGDTAYPGTPASYITPDTESLQLGLDDLQRQREDIIYSGTGDKNLIAESLNTATENMINSRSLEDRIREITLMVEEFETFIKQSIKDMHKDFASIEDYFITVRYGKRISIKNEDELLREITASKDAGMPSSYIEALHMDLIYAKYKNNKQELERQLLLADVEPLAGYTIDDLQKIREWVSDRDMRVKINFDSIIDEIEQETPLLYFMPDSDYRERVTAINKKIDEVLQKRVGALGPGGGQTMEPDDQDRTQD